MKKFILLVLLPCCGDPVTNGEINALPAENPIIPVGEFHRAVQIVFIRERDGGKFVAFGQFDNGFDRKRRIEKGKITVNVQWDESRRGAE